MARMHHPSRPYGARDDDWPPRSRDPRLHPRTIRTGCTASIDGAPAGPLTFNYVDVAPPGATETVVLLPGVVSTHRYFRDNIGPLAARYRVLAPDLPGFGRSEKPDAPYTTAWYVEAVLAFLDATGVTRAHLVGNSLGGQIAMLLAARARERVARLVLVSPAGFMPYEQALTRVMDLVGRAAFPEVGLPRVPRVPRTALHLLFRAAFPTRSDLVETWVRGYGAGVASPEYPLYVRAAFRSMRASLQAPMMDVARGLDLPTLIIWGERDRILSPRAARPLHQAIAGSRLLLYGDAGHCPMLDQASRWNDDVGRFLAAAEEDAVLAEVAG